jgi:hypothetical protein
MTLDRVEVLDRRCLGFGEIWRQGMANRADLGNAALHAEDSGHLRVMHERVHVGRGRFGIDGVAAEADELARLHRLAGLPARQVRSHGSADLVLHQVLDAHDLVGPGIGDGGHARDDALDREIGLAGEAGGFSTRRRAARVSDVLPHVPVLDYEPDIKGEVLAVVGVLGGKTVLAAEHAEGAPVGGSVVRAVDPVRRRVGYRNRNALQVVIGPGHRVEALARRLDEPGVVHRGHGVGADGEAIELAVECACLDGALVDVVDDDRLADEVGEGIIVPLSTYSCITP